MVKPTAKCSQAHRSSMVVFLWLVQTRPFLFLILASYSSTIMRTNVSNGITLYRVYPEKKLFLVWQNALLAAQGIFITRNGSFQSTFRVLSVYLASTEIIRSVICHANSSKIIFYINILCEVLVRMICIHDVSVVSCHFYFGFSIEIEPGTHNTL